MSWQNCNVVKRGQSPKAYRAFVEAHPKGDPLRVMTGGQLADIAVCAAFYRFGDDEGQKDALDYGTLFDALVMPVAPFDETFATQPATYEHKVMKCTNCGSIGDAKMCRACKRDRVEAIETADWDWHSDTCKKWKKEQREAGRIVVVPETMLKAKTAIERLMADHICATYIRGSDFQVHVTGEWLDAASRLVVPCQTLIDMVPRWEGATSIANLKTTRSGFNSFFQDDVLRMGYYFKEAMSLDMLNAATGEHRDKVVWITSDKEPPFLPGRKLANEQDMDSATNGPLTIDRGRVAYQSLLAHYCECLRRNFWPCYDDGPESVDGFSQILLRGFKIEAIEARMISLAPQAPLPKDPEPSEESEIIP